ncbi:MAG: endonuclease/exonuclease/phosphatase family protein [Verrucomicrobiota bacterium]
MLPLVAVAGNALAGPVTSLRVLSFNIWVQGGLSLPSCIQAIRTNQADIVGLQECNAVTAQTIASALGFYMQPGSDCTILSRYPILATYIAGYSRGVTVELSPGQRVHLFDVHLTAFPYGPYDLHDGQTAAYVVNQENNLRLPEVIQVLAAMQSPLASQEPCFLVGDFNAPSHFDYSTVAWPLSIACTNAGLGDSYRELHPANRKFPAAFAYNDPGITWTPKTDQEPDGVFDRIDFIYYAHNTAATPVNSTELDEHNCVNPWPSDHRAVSTVFSLVPPAATDQAGKPWPVSNATRVDVTTPLSWLPGSNAVEHAVYFGTVNPPPFLTNTTNPTLTVSNLAGGTQYFWRVDEITPDGTLTGAVWSFVTRNTNSLVYEWKFAGGNLAPALGNGVMAYADGATTSNKTQFGVTDGILVPHIRGQPAHYLHAPAFTSAANGYAVTLTGSARNGGGDYINEYTAMFDFLLPGAINWFPFFNTSPTNSNDADFYVSPDGAIGIAAIGYSDSGLIKPNTWYRVAFVADLANATVKYFLNGTLVCTGSADIDGRHSVYSGQMPGPDLRLLNEGDTSGVYTHEAYLSDFFFTDRALSDAEVQALGAPRARGILIPPSPIQLAISFPSTNVLLTWTGGDTPYQVQKTTDPGAAHWQNVGAPTNGTSLLLTPDGDAVFYRVQGP